MGKINNNNFYDTVSLKRTFKHSNVNTPSPRAKVLCLS